MINYQLRLDIGNLSLEELKEVKKYVAELEALYIKRKQLAAKLLAAK